MMLGIEWTEVQCYECKCTSYWQQLVDRYSDPDWVPDEKTKWEKCVLGETAWGLKRPILVEGSVLALDNLTVSDLRQIELDCQRQMRLKLLKEARGGLKGVCIK